MKKLLVICFALSLLFLMVAVVSADDMGKSQTVNGWVSDSKCGAKGANAGAAACTKKCIEGGASAVVVTDGDNKVLTVDNQDALKGHDLLSPTQSIQAGEADQASWLGCCLTSVGKQSTHSGQAPRTFCHGRIAGLNERF